MDSERAASFESFLDGLVDQASKQLNSSARSNLAVALRASRDEGAMREYYDRLAACLLEAETALGGAEGERLTQRVMERLTEGPPSEGT